MAQKKSKERPEEPLGTMSYQTSSKRSPPFWLLLGQKNTKGFWHQSEARTAVTVWNWSGKTLSPGALLAVLYFSSCHIFRPLRLSLGSIICPWVSEDGPVRVATSFYSIFDCCEDIYGHYVIQKRNNYPFLSLFTIIVFKVKRSLCRNATERYINNHFSVS